MTVKLSFPSVEINLCSTHIHNNPKVQAVAMNKKLGLIWSRKQNINIDGNITDNITSKIINV